MIIYISKRIVDLLTVPAEVTGRDHYNKYLQAPSWPTGQSGVTIGIGYDLGYHSREEIISDWQGLVNGNVLAFMLSCCGKTGTAAKAKITSSVKGFKIPYETACKVFTEKMLPRFVKQAYVTYDGLDKLNNDTIAVVVDLVFNRGTSFGIKEQKSWNTRREMRELAPLIESADYAGIAAKLREMKRLWDGLDDTTGKRTESETRIAGLLTRCDNRADYVLKSMAPQKRELREDDLIAYKVA